MPTYKAVLPETMPGLTLKNGTNVIIVEAADATDAAQLIQGHQLAQDDQLWANATITELTNGTDLSPVINPDTGQTNSFVATLVVAGATVSETFTYTAVSGDDFGDVAAALVILLNAHASIAGAAWASPTLTLSDVADGIGDHTVTPTFTYGGVTVTTMMGATTDGGIAGAALTQVFSTVVPLFTHLKS